MNEGPVNQGNLIETTDCLEAIGVFRRWKNLFFAVLLVCLLLVQAAFWLVDLNVVPMDGRAPAATPSTPPADLSAIPVTPPAEARDRKCSRAVGDRRSRWPRQRPQPPGWDWATSSCTR